ncbi:hypothetical protein [Nitrospira sp. M1]
MNMLGAMFVAAGLLWSSTALVTVAFAEERVGATLVVEDVLVLPGKGTQLKAFLFRGQSNGKRVGLGGEAIDFFVQNRLMGQGMTGEDGYAYLDYTPRLRGNLTITAKVQNSSRVSDQESTGFLFVWERRRPILLVDIGALFPANVQSDLMQSLTSLQMGSESLPDHEQDSSFELEKLGEFYYNIVYLYRSTSESNQAMQLWLKQHGFPPGIPMMVQPGPKAFIKFLEHMYADGWENVSAGIGRTVEFAEVLVERRIQTVIIQETESERTFPRRANVVTGWKKVRRYL